MARDRGDSPEPPATRAHAHPPDGALAQPGSGEVLFDGVRNHTASLGGYLWWMFVASVVTGAGFGLTLIPALSGWPLYLLGLVGLPGLLWVWLEHRTTRYRITARRVEYERGVFTRQVDSLELWRVLDVRYKQTLLDRLLGNGTITLVGTDQTHPELALHGLPNHRRLFDQIRDAVQAARFGNRPMEVVGHGQHGELLEGAIEAPR